MLPISLLRSGMSASGSVHRTLVALAARTSPSSFATAPLPRALHSTASAAASVALSSRFHPRVAVAASSSHASDCRCCAATAHSSHSLHSTASASVTALPPTASAAATASPRRFFSTIEALAPGSALEPSPSSPAAASQPHDPSKRFVAIYTCGVCELRSAKSISRQAYAEGVVLVRCDGCQKLHLFADNLGWFDDARINIEDILREKGAAVTRQSLQLAPAQIDQLQQHMDKLKQQQQQQPEQTNETTK